MYELVVAEHVHVEHGEADGLLCRCGEILDISWGDNSSGFADCDCGLRYGYKYKYEKFVRV